MFFECWNLRISPSDAKVNVNVAKRMPHRSFIRFENVNYNIQNIGIDIIEPLEHLTSIFTFSKIFKLVIPRA